MAIYGLLVKYEHSFPRKGDNLANAFASLVSPGPINFRCQPKSMQAGEPATESFESRTCDLDSPAVATAVAAEEEEISRPPAPRLIPCSALFRESLPERSLPRQTLTPQHGAAAEDKAEDEEDPGGDHQDNGRRGAVAIVLLADKHQNTVRREIGMAGSAISVEIQQTRLQGRSIEAVDIGQSRVATAHRMQIRLHFGQAQQRVIRHVCPTQSRSQSVDQLISHSINHSLARICVKSNELNRQNVTVACCRSSWTVLRLFYFLYIRELFILFPRISLFGF